MRASSKARASAERRSARRVRRADGAREPAPGRGASPEAARSPRPSRGARAGVRARRPSSRCRFGTVLADEEAVRSELLEARARRARGDARAARGPRAAERARRLRRGRGPARDRSRRPRDRRAPRQTQELGDAGHFASIRLGELVAAALDGAARAGRCACARGALGCGGGCRRRAGARARRVEGVVPRRRPGLVRRSPRPARARRGAQAALRVDRAAAAPRSFVPSEDR